MNHKTIIPELRFPGFGGGFEQTKFGKLYSFHTTNSLSREKLNYERGNVYNIHYGDIHTKFKSHFYLGNENVPYINDDVDLSKIKVELYCKTGDIIIADASEDYADIGKSIELIDIDNVKLLAGLHTLLARPISKKTSVGFTSYVLKSWTLRKQIMTIAQGSKVLSLSTGRVSDLELNIPTVPEQQKIASFLSAVDEKIQQLSRKKELLEQYKKSLMQQLFSGKLRFRGHSDKWQKIVFTDCCDLIHGFQFREEHFEKSGLPVIKIGSLVDNGSISFHNATYVSKDCENTHSRFILKKGDVLMALTGGTLGKVSRIDDDYGVIFQNYRVGKFKNKSNSVKEYIYYLLQSRLVQNRLKSLVNEAAQPNFGKQDFDKIRFELPSVPEQQKIADFLLSIDSKIESAHQQINQTQSFKKGLLQQLFV